MGDSLGRPKRVGCLESTEAGRWPARDPRLGRRYCQARKARGGHRGKRFGNTTQGGETQHNRGVLESNFPSVGCRSNGGNVTRTEQRAEAGEVGYVRLQASGHVTRLYSFALASDSNTATLRCVPLPVPSLPLLRPALALPAWKATFFPPSSSRRWFSMVRRARRRRLPSPPVRWRSRRFFFPCTLSGFSKQHANLLWSFLVPSSPRFPHVLVVPEKAHRLLCACGTHILGLSPLSGKDMKLQCIKMRKHVRQRLERKKVCPADNRTPPPPGQ